MEPVVGSSLNMEDDPLAALHWLSRVSSRERERGVQAVLPDGDDPGGGHVHGGAAVHEDHLLRGPVLLHHRGVHHRGH